MPAPTRRAYLYTTPGPPDFAAPVVDAEVETLRDRVRRSTWAYLARRLQMDQHP